MAAKNFELYSWFQFSASVIVLKHWKLYKQIYFLFLLYFQMFFYPFDSG